jgi:aminopeptidase N
MGCLLLCAGAACCSARLAGAAPLHAFGNPAVAQQPPKRSYHVENYKLTLRFDQPRGEIFGYEQIALEPLASGFTRFSLDSSHLSIESVALQGSEDGAQPLAFRAEGSRLWINLNRRYARGETLRVKIRYHGFPRAGLYFIHPSADRPNTPREIWSQGEPQFNHNWFPCWDYPNDMSTSEMVVTVAAGQVAVSNGRLLSVIRRGGQVTYDWVEQVPHSSYLTSLAVGPWRKVSDRYGRLPVDYYVPETVSAARARRSFHLTPDMIGFFSNALGVPYPYEKYAQVTVSHYFFGGMENVSATTLADTTLHDARAEPDYPSQALIAHELGQHWFGDLVQGRDWADIWLNEGFATYLEALYAQYHEDNATFRLNMMRDQASAMRQDREDYLRPIVDDHYTYPLQMFDSITHEKGAVVLDMLRNLLDGEAAAARPASQDELFFRALRSYLTAYRAQAVDTAALIRALQSSTGRKLGWFFREWVYMPGHPDYHVTATYDRRETIERLRVAQTQAGPAVPRVFVMPVELDFYGAHGQSHRLVIDDHERVQELAIPLGFKPAWVDFDPHDIIEKTLAFRQSVAALSLQAQRDRAAMSRIFAVRQLGTVTGPHTGAAVAALNAALGHDPFYGVRIYAAHSLGELHTPGAKVALLRALGGPDSRVRAAVIEALAGFRGDSDVYQALVERLDADPSYAVQAAAARAIGASGSKDAFAVLARVALEGSDVHVMNGILAGLAATGDARAVAILLTDARASAPEPLRKEALSALGDISGPARAGERNQLATVVLGALEDTDLSIRLTGEAVAGANGLSELAPEIRQLARAAPTAFERDAADEALRQLQPRSRRAAPKG